MRSIVFMLFLLSSIYAADRIRVIEFNGLSYMSVDLAKDITKLRAGDLLDHKKINETILAFYNQGYFSDVYARFKDGILTFYFKSVLLLPV